MPGAAGHPAAAARTELIDSPAATPSDAWLIFVSEGPRFGEIVRVRGTAFLIGRASDCDLMLEDSAVSRQHVKIRIEGAPPTLRFMLHDLATDNGTFVNGTRQTPVELHNGDIIRIGRTELTFKHLG